MVYMGMFVIITLNFIIQSTLLQHFRFFGIIPNTSLIFVVTLSILWGKKKGATIGFIMGLLQDVLIGDMIGTNTLLYMLIGYGMGSLENSIFKDNDLTPAFFTMISTVAYHLMLYVIMYIINNEVSLLVLFRKVIWIESIYNAIISVFIYKIIYKFAKNSNFRIRAR